MNTNSSTNNKPILNIKFDARIKDGLIKRDDTYKPIMSSPNVYTTYKNIFFVPFVLINNADLDEAIGMKLNNQERQLVFLNISQFNSYVKYMTGRNDLAKKTQEEREAPGGIIEKNIRFILDLFFGNKAPFYLGDKTYTIQSYEWDRVFDYNNNSASIKLRFLLSEGKETGFMKSVEVSCAQKWDSIKADYAFLRGFKSDPEKSTEENNAAKKAWKEEYAAKEKDAPYTKQPMVKGKSIDSLRMSTKNNYSGLPIAQQVPATQLQAVNVQAQSAVAIEKNRARSQQKIAETELAAKSAEAEKERVAKAAEAEKERLAKAAEAEKERLAKAAEAEKERLAKADEVERQRLEKAAEAEKERLKKEADDAIFKKIIGKKLNLINNVKEAYNKKIKTYEGRLATGKLEADEEIKKIEAGNLTRKQKETKIQVKKREISTKEQLLETLKIKMEALNEIDQSDLETDFDKNEKIYISARDALKKVDERSTSWTIEGERRSTRKKRNGGSSKRRTRRKKHK